MFGKKKHKEHENKEHSAHFDKSTLIPDFHLDRGHGHSEKKHGIMPDFNRLHLDALKNKHHDKHGDHKHQDRQDHQDHPVHNVMPKNQSIKHPDEHVKETISNRIKGMRGLFYRKATSMVEHSEQLKEQMVHVPDFNIQTSRHIVEFPKVTDITKVNITYPLIEPFAYANVKWNTEKKEVEYLVVEPQLNEEEKAILKKIVESLIEMVDVGLDTVKNVDKTIPYIQQQIAKIMKDLGIVLTDSQYTKIMYYIYKDFVGFNEIEPFLQDPNIEDISCDGTNTPIFIIHRKFGSVKTNILFEKVDELREFIVKLSERTGRYVSYAEPILDGTLPDGSRVSATLASDVATRGPTFTIRKFSEKPFSPTEQINMGTADPSVLAYFWYLVENGASMLVVGGVATGKTSMLNTISMFIPNEAKIVSIEDTREIRIPHEHWIAGLTRTGFGIPTSGGKKYGEVTLFDLLRESFRQNPDYVIVGEVRGEETYVMFQGMSSGHPSLSTFHAGSVDSVIKRLTTPPINLSPSLIESLDIITVMIHAREHGKSSRRMKEVSEIVSIDTKTQEVKTNVVFRWDPVNDKYVRVNDSVKLEKVAVSKGSTVEEAIKDISDRKKVLEWLKENNTKEYLEVAKYVHMYQKEKQRLFSLMKQPVSLKAETKSLTKATVNSPAAEHKERPRRTSILELLGNIKMIKEK